MVLAIPRVQVGEGAALFILHLCISAVLEVITTHEGLRQFSTLIAAWDKQTNKLTGPFSWACAPLHVARFKSHLPSAGFAQR